METLADEAAFPSAGLNWSNQKTAGTDGRLFPIQLLSYNPNGNFRVAVRGLSEQNLDGSLVLPL